MGGRAVARQGLGRVGGEGGRRVQVVLGADVGGGGAGAGATAREGGRNSWKGTVSATGRVDHLDKTLPFSKGHKRVSPKQLDFLCDIIITSPKKILY